MVRSTTRYKVTLEKQAATFASRLQNSQHDRDLVHLARIRIECELMAVDDVSVEKREVFTQGRTPYFVVEAGEVLLFARKRSRRHIVVFKITWRSQPRLRRSRGSG